MLGICTSVPENFHERQNQILLDYSGWWHNQSCQIVFKSVDPDVFGKRWKTLQFLVQTVGTHALRLLYYRNNLLW